jgi:preprotein translocase subunit Sss1
MTNTQNSSPRHAAADPRPLRSWPLYALAAPAAVAVWSGWVGLGEMTGFGKVHPLPGIIDGFSINTAITLPIGVEAYAAYALGAWLTRKPLSEETRRFARVSAVGALILGMVGQVAYHLLEVGHHTSAPTWVTTIVACFPVLVLGMGATLAHLVHRDARANSDTETPPETAPTDGEVGAALVATAPPPTPADPVASSAPTVGDSADRQKTANSTPVSGASGTAKTPATRSPRQTGSGGRNRRKTTRRSMDEWVALTEPIFHSEFKRLRRKPTADEFATAIAAAGHGRPSSSTAKNIRTEILDRAELPSLD